MTAAAPGGLSPLSQVARVERACEDSSRIMFGLHDLLFGWSQEIVGWVASPHLSASKKTPTHIPATTDTCPTALVIRREFSTGFSPVARVEDNPVEKKRSAHCPMTRGHVSVCRPTAKTAFPFLDADATAYAPIVIT
jgi:hypothetical protein